VKPALFTPEAEADVGDGFEWYEAQRPRLGDAFRRAVDIAVAAVEEHPEAHAVLHRDTHRVLLPRFLYGLYYRVLNQNIVVVACMHAKRHPRTWRSR
jgi:plasmid stabilization system protein ParE